MLSPLAGPVHSVSRPPVPQNVEALARVEEELADGVELVGSCGEGAKDCEIEDDDGQEDGDDVDEAGVEVAVGAAAQVDGAGTRRLHLCVGGISA